MNENDILYTEQSVETDNLGGESVEVLAETDEIEVFSSEGITNGTISEIYLNYFEGIVEKLDYSEHYVVWRSGDYSYSIAYGEDMFVENGLVRGEALNCVRIYRDSVTTSYNWLTKTETLETLSLDATGAFVYSDMGDYPTLERGLNNGEAMAILFAIGFALVYNVCNRFFDCVHDLRSRK